MVSFISQEYTTSTTGSSTIGKKRREEIMRVEKRVGEEGRGAEEKTDKSGDSLVVSGGRGGCAPGAIRRAYVTPSPSCALNVLLGTLLINRRPTV